MPHSEQEFAYPAGPAQRLDRWLVQQLPACSRSKIQRLLKTGRILVNGDFADPSYKLRAGDRVRYEAWKADVASPEGLEPETLPLDILYEDESILVLNKAPGMLVHPGAGRTGGSVANALLAFDPAIAGVGDPERPGIVHRLDADTSGALVVARTESALLDLQKQFKSRNTHKEYRALVRGCPRMNEFRCDGAIGRSPHDRKKMAVLEEGGREAVSHMKRLRSFAGGEASELAICIETGRTHQIRVHTQHAGYPVLGDRVYGGRRSQLPDPTFYAPRQMLHAFRLRFDHPEDKTVLTFEAPLPADYLELIRKLEQH